MRVMMLIPLLPRNMRQALGAMNDGGTPILNPRNNFICSLMKQGYSLHVAIIVWCYTHVI